MLSIRLTGKQSEPMESLLEELLDLGIETKAPASHPRILIAPSDATGAIIRSVPFQEGRITIQGEHAVRAFEKAFCSGRSVSGPTSHRRRGECGV